MASSSDKVDIKYAPSVNPAVGSISADGSYSNSYKIDWKYRSNDTSDKNSSRATHTIVKFYAVGSGGHKKDMSITSKYLSDGVGFKGSRLIRETVEANHLLPPDRKNTSAYIRKTVHPTDANNASWRVDFTKWYPYGFSYYVASFKKGKTVEGKRSLLVTSDGYYVRVQTVTVKTKTGNKKVKKYTKTKKFNKSWSYLSTKVADSHDVSINSSTLKKYGKKCYKKFPKLSYLEYKLWADNKCGHCGKNTTSGKYKFGVPNKPTVSSIYLEQIDNAYTSKVAVDIEAAESKTATNQNGFTEKRRIATGYVFGYKTCKSDGVYTKNTGSHKAGDPKWKVSPFNIIAENPGIGENSISGFNTKTSFTLKSDTMDDILKLGRGEYILFEVDAWSIGSAGDSGTIVKKRKIGQPGMVSVGTISVDKANSAARYVTIQALTNKPDSVTSNAKDKKTGQYINSNVIDWNHFPTEKITLQRLKNSTSTSASAAGIESGWEDVTGQIYRNPSPSVRPKIDGFVDSYAEAISDPGKYTWYRFKTECEPLPPRYGVAVRASAIYREPSDTDPDPVANDKCQIFDEKVLGADSISFYVAFKNDDSNQTEISWSNYKNAWKSNNGPSTMQVNWKESTNPSTIPTGWTKCSYVELRGLEEGTPIYVKARRSNGSSYGPYVKMKKLFPITPVSVPVSVDLSAPEYVARGKSFELQWTYESETDAEQKQWKLYMRESASDTDRKLVASGNDTSGSYEFSFDGLNVDELDALYFSVDVSTGGDFQSSADVRVNLADPPIVSASVYSDVVSSQPLNINLSSNTSNIGYILKVISCGYSNEVPDRTDYQANGEVVYSKYYTPKYDSDYIESAELSPTGVEITSIMEDSDNNIILDSEDTESDDSALVWSSGNVESESGIYSSFSNVDRIYATVLVPFEETVIYESLVTDDFSYGVETGRQELTYDELVDAWAWYERNDSFSVLPTIPNGFSVTKTVYAVNNSNYGMEGYTGNDTFAYRVIWELENSGSEDLEMMLVTLPEDKTVPDSIPTPGIENEIRDVMDVLVIESGSDENTFNGSFMVTAENGVSPYDFVFDANQVTIEYNEDGTIQSYAEYSDIPSWLTVEFSTDFEESDDVIGDDDDEDIDYSEIEEEIEENDIEGDTNGILVRWTATIDDGTDIDEEYTIAIVRKYTPESDLTEEEIVAVREQQEENSNVYVSDKQYTADVTLPVLADLYDMGRYFLYVSAKDLTTGLSSEEYISSIFDVNYAHQAAAPSNKTKVIPRTDKSVEITPGFDENVHFETDVVDIYRVTPNGASLIASDVEFGSTITDPYAPFTNEGANLRYRLCTKTTDGDIDWDDFMYKLYGYSIRFDWGENKHIELPYNITIKDSYSKDVEIRNHMDGTNAAYWNTNITRNSTLTTKMVKIDNPTEKELVLDLAKESGPVFVRLPNGAAYQANVEVKNYSDNYDSQVLDVSFEVTEITPTSAYVVPNL